MIAMIATRSWRFWLARHTPNEQEGVAFKRVDNKETESVLLIKGRLAARGGTKEKAHA